MGVLQTVWLQIAAISQGRYRCCLDNIVAGLDVNIIATVTDSVLLEKIMNYIAAPGMDRVTQISNCYCR